MSRVCDITGKKSNTAGGYSNRVRATQYNPTGKRRQQVNLHRKRVYVPELGKTFTLTISTQAMRTIKKNGAFATLKKAGIIK